MSRHSMAVKRYNDKSMVQLNIRLNKLTDADILDFLGNMREDGESIAGLVKRLLRKEADKKSQTVSA